MVEGAHGACRKYKRTAGGAERFLVAQEKLLFQYSVIVLYAYNDVNPLAGLSAISNKTILTYSYSKVTLFKAATK